MARNRILVLAALLATTTLCHGARPLFTALLTSDPYAAQAVNVEAGNDAANNLLAEAEVAASDNDNTASLAGATEIVSTAADNDNVASAIPEMIPTDVNSNSVGFLTASVSLPGSDNVIAALALPRRKGSLVSVIDDPTDNTASVRTSASAAAGVADLSAATTVTFDDPTDNTASVGASAASAAVIVDDFSDNTASAATTAIIDDPTDNTASAVESSSTVVYDPTDNTASAGTGDAAQEETTTTAYVSLPGSDNKIYAYHVPARREGMLVVVNGEGSN